jgi:hypothetical protein
MQSPLNTFKPQPIRLVPDVGWVREDGTAIPFTIEQVVGNFAGPKCTPFQLPLIRRALCLQLRAAMAGEDEIPDYHWSQGAYEPFSSGIRSLLKHPFWEQTRIVAAPFPLAIQRFKVAGALDFITELPRGKLAIGAVFCTDPDPRYSCAAAATLGAGVAALVDHHHRLPDHCIAIWAQPAQTTITYHHPDICLGQWVDAWDAARWQSDIWDAHKAASADLALQP